MKGKVEKEVVKEGEVEVEVEKEVEGEEGVAEEVGKRWEKIYKEWQDKKWWHREQTSGEKEGGRGGRVKGIIRMTTHQVLILSA